MSGEQMGVHNQGNWSSGKAGSCVVSDAPSNVSGGDQFDEDYGGYLICESIGRSNVPIVAAAPKMFKALLNAKGFCLANFPMYQHPVMIAIDEAIADATTPIAPVQSQPVPDPDVKYEDIDQYDVFIKGDQYQDVGNGSDRWLNVELNIGNTRSQSSLHHCPCRRPVKPATVEPVAEPACGAENEKPPLGIVPAILWIESRRDDIYAAIDRYRAAQYVVPAHLLLQLASIEAFLQDDSDEAQLIIEHPYRKCDSQ